MNALLEPELNHSHGSNIELISETPPTETDRQKYRQTSKTDRQIETNRQTERQTARTVL